MSWSVLTWIILRISQSQFLFGEVRAKSRHNSYTKTLKIQKSGLWLLAITGLTKPPSQLK